MEQNAKIKPDKRLTATGEIIRWWITACDEATRPDATVVRRGVPPETIRRFVVAYGKALRDAAIVKRRSVSNGTLRQWVAAYDEAMESGVIVKRDDFTRQCQEETGCDRYLARVAYHDYLPKSRKNRRGARGCVARQRVD